MSKEEHVSVPREFLAMVETVLRNNDCNYTADGVKAILSRATPVAGVVEDWQIDCAIDAAQRADTYPGFVGYRKVAMRAALESLTTSLPESRVPDGKPFAWVYRYRDGDYSTRIFFIPPDQDEIDGHRKYGGDIVPLYLPSEETQ